jgi:3-methylcrotonyl-CoA carboxylase beta subunit
MGSCTAGGAYVPAMSDETIIVRNQGTIFLGGPPLVKAATGEVVSAEELGGADVHSKNPASPITTPRTIAMRWHLPAHRRHAEHEKRIDIPLAKPREPKYAPSELDGIVPVDLKQAVRRARGDRAAGRRLRVRRVQGALRHDAGHRLRAYSRHPVGILANNGILFSRAR